MVQQAFLVICRQQIVVMAAAVCAALVALPGVSQQASPFQIVWVVIGEAASGADNGPADAGRQLFMASDLMSKNMASVKVEQVEVDPVIHELAIGQRLCVTTLNIRALGPDRKLIEAAPLSIAIRQDQKQRLGLNRTKRDICVLPTAPGEYPMRLTSMLPAQDGTMRGAQVYIRVSDPKKGG